MICQRSPRSNVKICLSFLPLNSTESLGVMFRLLVLLQNVSHNHLLIIKQKIIFYFSTDKNDSKRNQFAFVHNTDNALNFIHDENDGCVFYSNDFL